MKKNGAKIFLGLMAVAFCKVGVEALIDPQAVVSAVGIVLDNNSALSSIRAVYGGMHLVFGLFCAWGIFRELKLPLTLIVLYTGGFLIGRISGMIIDGAPNAFVNTWLVTETVSLAIASLLLWVLKTTTSAI